MALFKNTKVNKLTVEVQALEKKLVDLQSSTNILLSDADLLSVSYKGNPYVTYESQVTSLAKKYEGQDKWGNQIAQNIIKIRSAFTLGQGLHIYEKEKEKGAKEPSKEYEFAKELFNYNDFDQEVPGDFANEAEIEGKCLVKLFWNTEKKMVDVRHISYTEAGYEVETAPEDYKCYTKVLYKLPKRAERTEIIEEPDFVYKKFGGRIFRINKTFPKLGLILRNMEDMDKCLWDLRKIDKLFASPTPIFECATKTDAGEMSVELKKINWKIGKVLATTAKYRLVGVEGENGVQFLLKEIEAQAKIIAGTSGVGVHWLGFPELMSNRATAENLMESLYAATKDERKTWIGFYEELIDKALEMANKENNQNYVPGKVGISIPFVTAQKMAEIADVYLPLYVSGAITLETLLTKVPEVDAEKELQKIDENNLTTDLLNKDIEEEEGEKDE